MSVNLPVFDGFSSLQGGMNGGVLSTLIAENQYAKGVNVACRNGTLSTRPQVIEVEILGTEAQLWNIQHGKFQGMHYYQHEGHNFMAMGINGSVYLIEPISGVIYDMTALIGTLDEAVDRLHFCQCERYLVVQDGINTPVIIEDTASRLAVQGAPDSEVPTGTLMAYTHGRLFIKTEPDRFIAGNINQSAVAGSVLVFTETQYLAGGNSLFMPVDVGQLTALTWAHAYGEATGDGPLLAMYERGIVSFKVSVPRMQWQDMPIMKLEPSGNGNASEYCVVRFNEDLLFMSWNGIQDFALLNTETATRHRLTNLNSEIMPFLALETQSNRRLAMGCKFDDRLLFTVLGDSVTSQWNDNGVIKDLPDYRFKGLISLDFAPNNGISSLGAVTKPSYDGIWTGFNPMGIASGLFDFEEMCFIMGKDDDGHNHLYRLMKSQGDDQNIANGSTQIQCRLYTQSVPFVLYQDGIPRKVPHMEKILKDANLWISAFQGNVDINLSVCPDFSGRYNQISTIKIRAPMALTTSPFTTGYPQCRPKEFFPAFMQQSCQPVSRRNALRGFQFQFLLDWAGVLNINKFMISAEAQNEVPKLECGTNTEVLVDVPPDDLSYDIEDVT